MEDFIGLTAVVLIFGSLPAVIIYIVWRGSRERMEMIKSGVNPLLYTRYKGMRVGSGALLGGLVVTAIGIGCAISAIFIQYSFDRDLMTVATVFMLVGLSVLTYWGITKKDREREQAQIDQQIARLEKEYGMLGNEADVTR